MRLKMAFFELWPMIVGYCSAIFVKNVIFNAHLDSDWLEMGTICRSVKFAVMVLLRNSFRIKPNHNLANGETRFLLRLETE